MKGTEAENSTQWKTYDDVPGLHYLIYFLQLAYI